MLQAKLIRYNNSAAKYDTYEGLGVLDNLNPADADSATFEGGLLRHANQFSQHLYNASLDVSAPVNFSNDITAIFKAGGKVTRSIRENNVDEDFSHGEGDMYENPAANNYFPGITLSAGNPLRLSYVVDKNFTRGQYYLNSLYNFTNGRGFTVVIDESKYDAWLKLSEQGWAVPLEAGR